VHDRGKPEVPSWSVRSVFTAKVGRHSEKPDEFYQIVEELCQEQVKRIQSRKGTGSPYFLAKVLVELPTALCGEHDIEEILSALVDDISDTLSLR